MKKIAFITPWFIPRYGGGETQLRKISEYICNNKWNGTIYTLQFGSTKTTDKIGNVLIKRFKSAANKSTKKKAFISLANQIFNKDCPNCIYMHLGVSSDLPVKEECKIIEQAHYKNIPIIIRVTSTGRIKELNKLYSKSNEVLKLVTKFIVLNDEIRQELFDVGIGLEQIFRTNNGVNTKEFFPIEEKEKLKIRKKLDIENKLTFICHARFSHKKNINLLLEEWTSLCRKDNSFSNKSQLLIIGDNNKNTENIKTTHEIENTLKKSKMKNIFLLGSKKHPKMHLYLKASDSFVNLSMQEGMSNSTLEAISTGLVCLLADNKTNRYLAGGKGNILTKMKDNSKVSKALKKISQMNQEQVMKIQKENRKRALELFNDKLILPKYLGLVESVVNK